MSLSLPQQKEWERTIKLIKDIYPDLHYFYSINEGWCYVSFKQHRIKLKHATPIFSIRHTIDSLVKYHKK